jgi:hypothetical protein
MASHPIDAADVRDADREERDGDEEKDQVGHGVTA